MMTSPTTDRCILSLTEDTLSAWRDELLGQHDMRRIAEHLPTCLACQHRIRDFERIGQVLRTQRIPSMQARVWSGLRDAINNNARRGPGRWARPTAGKGLATLAAALLVALFVSLLYGHIGRPSLPGNGTPTASLIATNTLTATTSPTATTMPSGDWQHVNAVGDQGFPTIAFAPSQPTRAYACTIDQANGYQFVVSVSSDSGKTWRIPVLPGITGTGCLVSVNPIDPQDVVVVNIHTQNGIVIARSIDGGATWTKPDVGNLAIATLGWVGSSLFVATQVAENPVNSQVNLYVSTKGQPFVRLDHNGMVSGITLQSPRFITGLGSTVFLQWGQIQPPVGETTIVSHDNGQTWTPITFRDGSQLVHLINATPTVTGDALVMVGIYDSPNNQVAISRDEGAAWQKLPAASPSVPAYQYVGAAPDGTVFAVSSALFQQDNPDRNIYMAHVGDDQWRIASVLPVNALPLTAAWDANGHPTDFWAFWASLGYLIVYHL